MLASHCTVFIVDHTPVEESCFNSLIPSLAFYDYKEDGPFPKPPSYNVATTLPSYDEAERSKAEATVPLVADRVSRILI